MPASGSMTHCLVTVGTGTAGSESFVASGILVGIRHTAPAHVWLCPSASPESREVAAYVASELAAADPAPAIHTEVLADPDDLHRCRRELRALLRKIRADFPPAHLVVNPTSGTKMMTTAAVLAAIDEEITDIQYVGGERADGVVRTGAERVVHVDGRSILARRTARNALALAEAGAYRGAERILEAYADLFPRFSALVRALGFWHRFAYRRALRAAPEGPEFRELRRSLDVLANASPLSLAHAADMAAFTERALEFGEPEEALAVLYRLAEFLAKIRLRELGVDPSAPALETIREKLVPPKPLHDKLVSMFRHNREMHLGLALALELLGPTRSPLHAALFADRRTWSLLQERQQTRYGHGLAFVDPARVRELRARVVEAGAAQWPEFPGLVARFRFPKIHPLIKEELEHV